MISDLSERSRDIFKYIVDSYVETGMPVGSKSLSDQHGVDLSPATIRNVMSELEKQQLLYAPHVSAGRLPTQKGLRLYIDGLMEVSGLTDEEQKTIDKICDESGHTVQGLMDQTSHLLSGLSNCASLVMTPKRNKPVEHIQFVKIDTFKILVILVMAEDEVENRILETEEDISQSALDQASNYLNHKLLGKTINEARKDIMTDIQAQKTKLDTITETLVQKGLALPRADKENLLIIRGQSRLLQDVKALEDLDQAKDLLSALEEKETTANLLNSLEDAQGVQIYIGTENEVFSYSGWSVILSPYRKDDTIIGAVGVIGPTRLNYGRVIPIVDYTSKVIDKILNKSK